MYFCINKIFPLNSYTDSLIKYTRRQTQNVTLGDIGIGSEHPIRIQSMTTIDTMDTMGSVEQTIRMIESGCEIVRITAPSVKEAQNLENIKNELRKRGYNTPLVADIHFTPNAAELAARIVEKVRINPGNYADKKRFETIDYTDSSYVAELDRIRERFMPLVKICKEYGTAMRIGTNHGSLSDRILSRYGDTPLGMVESALEFLKICEDMNYYNVVLSMKSSNPQVMVHAYRLLVKRLAEDGLRPYPLHLGVTEAGEGEDGRIKSAMGIGSLLEDGLGDTVRVSLTEDPEFEAPVAIAMVNRLVTNVKNYDLKGEEQPFFDPFSYKKRSSVEVANFGGLQVPRVIADYSKFENIDIDDLKSIGYFYLPLPDKWRSNDLGADYIYTADKPLNFMPPNGLREIVNLEVWNTHAQKKYTLPLLNKSQFLQMADLESDVIFVKVLCSDFDQDIIEKLKQKSNIVLILESIRPNSYQEFRAIFSQLQTINIPVLLAKSFSEMTLSDIQIQAATDLGGLMVDGFGDGLMLSVDTHLQKDCNSLAFGVLQAARCRMTKTEYISCPSCGRTLFDLQETTAKIRNRTDHLKGVKIGIMGCIVNGPGEMADADYGYVGIGKDKISLYRGQEVVQRSVVASEVVDKLIELIKEDGRWLEPSTLEEN